MAASSEKFHEKELEAWLREQPLEVSFAIAARSALRVTPLLRDYLLIAPQRAESLLQLFRANCLAYVAASISETQRTELATTSDVIRDRARDAVRRAPHSSLTDTGPINAAYAASSAATTIAASTLAFAARYAAGTTTSANKAINLVASASAQDQDYFASGLSTEGAAALPLWPEGLMPPPLAKHWEILKATLLSRDEDWDIWTTWYEDRLRGAPPEPEELAVARVTLPEPMWKLGPKVVNAEIKTLIQFFGLTGPEAIDQRMAELRAQYPEASDSHVPTTSDPSSAASRAQTASLKLGEASAARKSRGQFTSEAMEEALARQFEKTTDASSDTEEGDESKADLSAEDQSSHLSNLPNVWLLQYNPSEWSPTPQETEPGAILRWKTARALPRDLKPGDPVVYWRMVHPDNRKDRGGAVGVGRVLEFDADGIGWVEANSEEEKGVHRFPTEVRYFSEADRLDREVLKEEIGLSRTYWQGAVLDLPTDEATKLDNLLRREGRPTLFTDEQRGTRRLAPKAISRETHETPILSDRPETSRDLLNRAPLAFALATHVNHTWTEQTHVDELQVPSGLAKKIWHWICRGCRCGLDWIHLDRISRKTREPDEAAFILHIDAPWGGGKTTFANHLARFLNREAHGIKNDDPLIEGLRFQDWDQDFQDRRWFTVEFNAWQHEHVSPPWWNFYESIRRQTLRALLFEDGRFSRAHFTTRWFLRGFAWLRFQITELIWRVATPEVRNMLLLVIIGFAFLYWMTSTDWFASLVNPPKPDGNATDFSPMLKAMFSAAGIAATGGAGLAIINAFRSGLKTVIDSAGKSANSSSLGVADPIQKFRRHFNWYMTQLKHPVLVVIDDLDRCSPQYVVELVRGLLTIFRSPRVVFVLLGDKDWIETAFAKVHKDMADAHQDTEVSFGGRFAEKAIQLSFLLPEADRTARDVYLKALLGAEIDDEVIAAPEDATELEEAFNEVDTLLSTSETFEEQNKAAEMGANIIEQRVASASADRQATLRKAGETYLNRAKMQRAATARSTREEIKRHGLRPLKEALPANPRRIKRIINMVSAYQASAQAIEKVDLGSARWQQLVLWILIMCEYPKVWQEMVRSRDFTESLFGSLRARSPATSDASPDGEDHTSPLIKEILANDNLVRLLEGVPFAGKDDAPSPAALSTDAVSWLRRLTPIN